jgi:hypothetical protein
MHWLTWRPVLSSISDNLKVLEQLLFHAYYPMLILSLFKRVFTSL